MKIWAHVIGNTVKSITFFVNYITNFAMMPLKFQLRAKSYSKQLFTYDFM